MVLNKDKQIPEQFIIMFKNQVNKVPIWISVEEVNKYLHYNDIKDLRRVLNKSGIDPTLKKD